MGAISDILFEEKQGLSGKIGVVTLNRPKALNALTWEMSKALHRQLDTWAEDDAVRAVVIHSTLANCFCAGGDVRRVYDEHQKPASPYHSDFFRDEYELNRAIFHFPKPYIALIDGICLGGGLGVSVHGSHVVVTDNARLACPETRLGFFPDISASYFLSQCPGAGAVGMYLGLSCYRMRDDDAVYAGLAQHRVASADIDGVMNALLEIDFSKVGVKDVGAHEAVSACLNKFEALNTTLAADHDNANIVPHLEKHRTQIEACFSAPNVEDIFQRLGTLRDAEDATEGDRNWAQATLRELESHSPLSLKVTFELLRRAKAERLSLDACAELDYIISQHFMNGSDFFEGVRALLVDKDKNPKWQPASLAEVSDAEVLAYFERD